MAAPISTKTNEPHASYVTVTVKPDPLKIFVELNRRVFFSFTITNQSNSLVTVKCRFVSTVPCRYQLDTVNPKYIGPHATVVWKIYLEKMAQYPDAKNMLDTFTIQSAIVENELPDFTNYWKELESQHIPALHRFMFAETKIPCQLVPPYKYHYMDSMETSYRRRRGAPTCGFPCCHCGTQKLIHEKSPTHKLRGIYSSDEEWQQFTCKIRKILSDHTVPPCPFLLPCCLTWWCYRSCARSYHAKQEVALKKLVEEENQRLFKLGLIWVMKLSPCEGETFPYMYNVKLTMLWREGVREVYERTNPNARPISKELTPLQLAEYTQRAAAAKEAADRKQKQDQIKQLKQLQAQVAQLTAVVASSAAAASSSHPGMGNDVPIVPPPIYGQDDPAVKFHVDGPQSHESSSSLQSLKMTPPTIIPPIVSSQSPLIHALPIQALSIQPSAPPCEPVVRQFCFSCGASRVGVTGPFCPKCGQKTG